MVRRDLEPYQTASNFIISQGWGGNSTATANNNYPNPDIKPEKVVSYEFGGDFRFFNSRVGIDVAYYKSITTDLIIPITLNPSAGYDTKLMNVGKMTNQGIELMVNVVPVRTKDLEWSLNFNFSKNKNKVVALAEDKESHVFAKLNGGPLWNYVLKTLRAMVLMVLFTVIIWYTKTDNCN